MKVENNIPLRSEVVATPQKKIGMEPTAVNGKKAELKNAPTKTLEKPFGSVYDKALSMEEFTDALKDPQKREEFDKMLETLNQVMFQNNNQLKLSVHEKTGTTVARLINSQTHEVIKEFPSEKVLNVVAGIWELAGILVDKKA